MDRGEVYKAYPCKLSVLSLFLRGECCERLKVLAFLVFQLLDAFLAYLTSELHASFQAVVGGGLVYLDVGVGAKVQVDVSVVFSDVHHAVYRYFSASGVRGGCLFISWCRHRYPYFFRCSILSQQRNNHAEGDEFLSILTLLLFCGTADGSTCCYVTLNHIFIVLYVYISI